MSARDLASAAAVVVGVAALTVGALGVLRRGEVLARLHASSLASGFGALAVLVGVALGLGGAGAARAVAVAAGILVATTASTQVLANARWRERRDAAREGGPDGRGR